MLTYPDMRSYVSAKHFKNYKTVHVVETKHN